MNTLAKVCYGISGTLVLAVVGDLIYRARQVFRIPRGQIRAIKKAMDRGNMASAERLIAEAQHVPKGKKLRPLREKQLLHQIKLRDEIIGDSRIAAQKVVDEILAGHKHCFNHRVCKLCAARKAAQDYLKTTEITVRKEA